MPVEVEVDVGPGLPTFAIVGLPDAAVQEARERVRAALKSSGFDLPSARIVVNLAPGPLRKHGTGFDLPIALGLLVATRQLPGTLVAPVLSVGELSLDGSLRRVPGLIAHALAARAADRPLLAPTGERGAASLDGLSYLALGRLAELRSGLPRAQRFLDPEPQAQPVEDFADVIGQGLAVRALVIAAAGGHNILLIGPPGSGKTMLARRLPTILPALGRAERLETALVHSVAGLDPDGALAGHRPFRAPHHSASVAGIVGGGSPPRPGEASLAHNGVLFLDEMPEFGPASLQCLRQPLEDGSIVLVRAEGRVAFPARFALVGAANPCPCGFLGDAQRECRCVEHAIERYRGRIGGPLMDRIDLVVSVDQPDPARLLDGAHGPASCMLRRQVLDARERSIERTGVPVSALSGAELLASCLLDRAGRAALEASARQYHLSGRGVTRLLRVARTIADLEGVRRVNVDHVAEALGFRTVERV